MRSLLLYVTCVGLVFRGQAAGSEQVVIRKVKDQVSLECPAVGDGDEYKGVMWNKNTVAFLTSDRDHHVDYISGTPSSRISIKNKHQLTLADLEMSDSGNYSCQIYVNKSGALELKETAYLLTVQDVPSAPIKPVVKDIQSRQAVVTWVPSNPNNSPITAYVLNIRDCQTGVTAMDLVVSNESSTVTVDGLSPYMCYTVRVSAVNAVGRSSQSEASDLFYTTEEGSSETRGEQAGMSLRWVNALATRSQMAPVVLLMLATSRCLKCNVWRVAAFLSLAAPVYGSESKVPDVLNWILWLLVCLTLIVLFLCYRFRLWRLCYTTAMKYVRVNRYEEPAATDSIETFDLDATFSVIPTETEASALNSSLVSEIIFHDVDIKDFANKVRRMKLDGDLGFSTEFQEVNDATKNYSFSAAHFYMEKNKSRNRYLNIPAYDHSRVVLKADDSTEEESDYVNANYVLGYKKPQPYIATQGPLPNTVCDFWRMVWEQNSNVIVMITNFHENGRSKCEQYWPTKGEEEYGRWTVRLMSTNHHAYYTIRVLALTDGERHCRVSAEVRTVHHYHYTQWPDHGVPCHALPVLSFVHKSAAHWKPESGPIVVHCSAGVGRTGAYILIDSMMAQIQDKCSLNIPRFLLHMRRQRHFLVQTEEQYKFVHEVLVEYLQSNGTTEVSEEQLPDYLPLLEQPFRSRFMPNTQNATLLDKQFQLITEYTAREFELAAALDPANESKNSPGSLLATCSSRVVLSAKPGIPGSDYINASFLQGYTKVEEFVVTQHPAEHTVPDFWRMVWHVRSPVIVVLSYPREKENVEFWPTKGAGKNLNAEGFCITTKHETALNNAKGLTILDVDMINFNEDFATLLTRVLLVKDWPHRFKRLHKVFGAISIAHSYVTSFECGPVVVVDRFGGVEAGTFCALWTLRDQLLSERCADFYQVCKLYHYKRPGIFKSQETYLFIHRALVAFHKHMQARNIQKNVGILYENGLPCDHIYSN